ncbi:MAG TPA: glycosyltransferase family 2 protein [Flavobacteriaceae bacterium]|nr:glycosyltransferase family 2 protein [Flavobacteriaceae bacterium]
MQIKPKISIIIPVYNTATYLEQCIESVLNQSFTDFELVLVNDGSTDHSGAICDDYAFKDGRIKVFHRENGGVSSARNLGLAKITGDWLTFIDSDDEVLPEFLETIYKERKGVDIVYQGAIQKNRQSSEQKEFEDFSDKIENVPTAFKNNMMTSHGYIWGKLFRSKIITINNIRFQVEISFSEDSLFVLDYLKYVDKIKFSSQKLYVYYETPGSLRTKKYPYEKELTLLNFANAKLTQLFSIQNIDPSLKAKELQYYLYRTLFSLYKSKNKERIDDLKYLMENFRNEFLASYKNAKGRGRLVYFSAKNGHIRLLNLVFKRLIYKNAQ